MPYILADQRATHEQTRASFQRYRQYLTANEARFPRGAFELATSAWYYDPEDHRCPHDARLAAVTVSEVPETPGPDPVVTLRIRLIGAYGDGDIELSYTRVRHYQLATNIPRQGHGDWRYDEFRLSDTGSLIHEIEWSGAAPTGRWIVEASDVLYAWHPRTRGDEGDRLTR